MNISILIQFFLIMMSFLIASLLSVMYFDFTLDILEGARPHFFLMCFIFWRAYFPQYFSFRLLIVLGLYADFFFENILGSSLLYYILLISIWNKSSKSFFQLSLMYRSMFIFIAIFFYELLLAIIFFIKNDFLQLSFFKATITSALLWPFFEKIISFFCILPNRFK